MIKSTGDFHTKHESGFAPAEGCKLPFDENAFDSIAIRRPNVSRSSGA
ncbi:hypothetical protein [Mesorhizobium caraganae]